MMKYLILFCSFFILLDAPKLQAQEEEINAFWEVHKEEALSLYLEYEELNKSWYERIRNNSGDDAKYTFQGTTSSGFQYKYYLLEAEEFVEQEERIQLEQVVGNTPILRAMFRVGSVEVKTGSIAELVLPTQAAENISDGEKWNADFNDSSGLVYRFRVREIEGIRAECTIILDEEGEIRDLVRVEIISDNSGLSKCIFYYPFDY